MTRKTLKLNNCKFGCRPLVSKQKFIDIRTGKVIANLFEILPPASFQFPSDCLSISSSTSPSPSPSPSPSSWKSRCLPRSWSSLFLLVWKWKRKWNWRIVNVGILDLMKYKTAETKWCGVEGAFGTNCEYDKKEDLKSAKMNKEKDKKVKSRRRRIRVDLFSSNNERSLIV